MKTRPGLFPYRAHTGMVRHHWGSGGRYPQDGRNCWGALRAGQRRALVSMLDSRGLPDGLQVDCLQALPALFDLELEPLPFGEFG